MTWLLKQSPPFLTWIQTHPNTLSELYMLMKTEQFSRGYGHIHRYNITDTFNRRVLVGVIVIISSCTNAQKHTTSRCPFRTAVSPDQAGPSALHYIYFILGYTHEEGGGEDLNITRRWIRVSSSGTHWLNTSLGGLDGWVRSLWRFPPPPSLL